MPESPEAREQLERLAAETGAFEELAAAYEDQLERGVTNATSTELWRRLAVALVRAARPAWTSRSAPTRSWRRREPRNMAVLESLARIHTRAGDARELAAVMKRMVMAEPSPPKQIDLLFRLGTLAEETLSDKQLAAQCYGEILARKPDDEDAIKFLGKVLTESERWPELASLIVREIQLADSTGRHEEMYDLMVRLGRLRLARLRDPRGALDIFEDVLRRKQGHAGAIGALEEMARSDSPLRGEAAEALEPIFTSGGDHLRLVQMLESRASTEPVAAGARGAPPQGGQALRRADAERRAGLRLREPGAPGAAGRGGARSRWSVDARPSGPATAARSWPRCSRRSSPARRRTTARVAILRALGKAQEKLGHQRRGHRRLAAGAGGRCPPTARRWGPGRALPGRRPRPGAAGDLQAAARDQRGAGGPRRAALPDRRTAGSAPSTTPWAPWPRSGACWSSSRTTPRRWRSSTRSARSRSAGRSWRTSSAGGWRCPAGTSTSTSAPAWRWCARRGSSTRSARSSCTGRCSPPSRSTRARWRSSRPGRSASPRTSRWWRCSSARTADRGEQAKLAGLLELRVGASPDPFERKQLLVELAGLREAGQDPAGLFGALARAFQEDPNDAALRAAPGQGGGRGADPRGAGPALRGGAPAHRRDEGRRGGAPRARRPVRAAPVEPRPGHRGPGAGARAGRRDLAPGAHRALPSLRTGRPERPAGRRAWTSWRSSPPTGTSGCRSSSASGQVAQDELEDEPRAADAFERLLAIDKTHLPAARLLESIYERSGTPDRLFNVLRIQRDLTSGPERERILAKMVKVSAEGLADLEASIELYSELFKKNPKSDQAFGALEQALEKAGRWEDLRALLAGQDSPDRRAARAGAH